MQRLLFLALTGLIGLGACAPLEIYYKTGSTVQALQRDTLACEVKALRDVPASTVVRREPPIYIPGKRICNAEGECRRSRGYYIPGGIERYDPNDGLRFRVERQCMADKGYTPVSIPACPDSVVQAAPARATTRLPVLTENSCVIRNRDGSVQIVTRG